MYTIDKSISQQINVMKLIFTLLVVFIHSEALPALPYELEVPIYVENCKQMMRGFTDVAVPGFAFFSGFFLFSKEFSWWENIRKKIRSILMPYLIINSFWIAFFGCVQKIPEVAGYFSASQYKIDSLNAIYNAYLGQMPLYYPFWFLKDIFILNIFAGIFQKILNKMPWLIIIALLFFQFGEIPFPLISNKQVFICFMVGGLWIRYGKDLSIIKKIPFPLLILVTFGITISNIWIDYIFLKPLFLVIVFGLFYVLADKLLSSRIHKGMIWGGGNLAFLSMRHMNIMKQ